MGKREPLTEAETRAYWGIINYFREHGYAPTVREICEITGYLSSSTAFHILESLVEKGWIETHGVRAIKVIGYKFVREKRRRNERD